MSEVVDVNSFDYSLIDALPCQKRRKGNPGRRRNYKHYKDIICAFDIEATNDKRSEQAFMYIWQFQLGEDLTIIGRTWAEFRKFIKNISRLYKNNFRTN